MSILDFARLNLSALCIGINIAHEDGDEAMDLLKNQPRVSFSEKLMELTT